MKTETISNAYQLLGIQSNATDEDIKKAYRKLSLEYHPDKHNNASPATAMFNIITQAKNVLLDPTSRLEHDYALGIKKRPQHEPEVKIKKVYVQDKNHDSGLGTAIAAGLVGLLLGALFSGGDSE